MNRNSRSRNRKHNCGINNRSNRICNNEDNININIPNCKLIIRNIMMIKFKKN